MAGEQKAESQKRKAKSLTHEVILGFFSFLLSALSFLLLTCSKTSDRNHINSSPKFTQYYNQGELLYQKHCSNCHQKDGTGLGRVYPPLNKSDFIAGKPDSIVCIIRYGKRGELVVNGISFNQPMPGIPTLTDLEIAEITTYILNTWENESGIIEVIDVSTMLRKCPSRNGQ